MEDDYIGKWVVEDVEVDYERVMSDLVIIKTNPSEFDFTLEEAIDTAIGILGNNETKIRFELELFVGEQ